MVLMQGNVKWWGMIGCTYHGMSEGDSFGGAVRNAAVFECQDIWGTTSALGISLSFIFTGIYHSVRTVQYTILFFMLFYSLCAVLSAAFRI
jgi:hypothetical protein